MQARDELISTVLAPGGVIRVAINLGNPVLARREADGELGGVSTALARALAARLGIGLELMPFDGAGKVVDAAGRDVWDLAFLARDPLRAEQIGFTAPYVTIEGVYAVRAASNLHSLTDVDRPGVRVCVGRGAAYDLHLTRTLKHAGIERCDTSKRALEEFAAGTGDAAAGISQAVTAFAAAHTGLRVIAEPFMRIHQAMAVPRARAVVVPYLDVFLAEMAASGFIDRALDRNDI